MTEFREQWLKDREQFDVELFEKIKGNPKPDISDLWALSEERFIEWRKLHDFPILLKHFDKTLHLFTDWKAENKLTNELIISCGTITPFLEYKKMAKDKTLYLTKQTVEGRDLIIVAPKNMGRQQEYLGRTYHFELLQTFTSYLDWLKKKENISRYYI